MIIFQLVFANSNSHDFFLLVFPYSILKIIRRIVWYLANTDATLSTLKNEMYGVPTKLHNVQKIAANWKKNFCWVPNCQGKIFTYIYSSEKIVCERKRSKNTGRVLNLNIYHFFRFGPVDRGYWKSIKNFQISDTFGPPLSCLFSLIGWLYDFYHQQIPTHHSNVNTNQQSKTR